MSKIELSENEIIGIVYAAAKKSLNEMNLLHRTYNEGKPQKASEVIRGNGWDGKVVSKQPGEMILDLHQSSDALIPDTSESLPFEQLVEDLNIFYQDNGLPLRATALENYNGQMGYFIKVIRQ